MADDILTKYEGILKDAADMYTSDFNEIKILDDDDSDQEDERDTLDESPGINLNDRTWLQTGAPPSFDGQPSYEEGVDFRSMGPRKKLPNRISLSSEASELPSETGGLNGSSAYFQAFGEANNQGWVLDNSDSGSGYTPRSAEFAGVNGDMEISDEALIDSALISYSPSEDVIPENEIHHAVIFHAAQTLAENGAEAVEDRIQTSGVSEDQAEEVVQAYDVLDQSLRRTNLDKLNVGPFEKILDSYDPETNNDF